ncbi:MAG: ABC transporter permease [Armatimonadota bacterium]
MSIFEAVRTAYASLASNKSRSLLTMLGVIIGVAAVLIVVAIGQGLSADTLNRIRAMGTNTINVMPGSGRMGPPGPGTRAGKLTEEDFELLEESLTEISAISPMVMKGVTAKYLNVTHDTSVVGTNTAWPTTSAFEIAQGRFFNEGEERARSRVAVIGQDIVDEMSGGREMLGETIRLDGVPFEIIGILERKGGGFGNPDDQVIIPITTARQRLVGNVNLGQIIICAASEDAVPRVIAQTEELLFRAHRVDEGSRDFSIRDQAELLSTISETTAQITLFLGGIAVVSLIVGGVGIMNIMLVSVTERTREIGVRKAVGARGRDILAQFLIESIMLSAIGGAIGIAVGFAGSAAVGSSLGWATVVPPWSVGLSFAFSVAVGVFFGWYPARKAALLDPIQCLRYE